MAATAKEMRAWAREQGWDVPERGQLPKEMRMAFETANGTAPDYPVDDDFGPTAFVEPPGLEPGGDRNDFTYDESAMSEPATGQVVTERAPARPPRGRGRPAKTAGPKAGAARPAGIRGLFSRGKAAGPGAARRKPRVTTDDMLAGLWRTAAKFATPLPPLHRTLRIQAPVAGMILEDAVRDTALDTFLQPLARLSGQGKVIGALIGPPMIVTGMMLHVQQSAAAGRPPNMMIMSVMQEALRSALMAWMEVAGPKFEIALQRETQFEEKYGKSVDDLIMFLLAPPPDTDDEREAEDAAIRRAQGFAPAA